jgi:hypothetical protein
LNVKQNDLLVIDRPRKGMKPEEHDLWDFLGLKPQPFENVRYLLPWGKHTQTTGLPNCYGEPPDQFQTYAYALEAVIGNRASPGPGLGLLIRVPDPWDTLGALIGEIQQGVANQEPKWKSVNTWNDLLNGPPLMISAEQFMSEVHGQVVGNCGTKVIGRSDSSELTDAAYRFISQDVKAHVTRLDKGELLLSHPIYRQPVKIEFPRPAYQSIGH